MYFLHLKGFLAPTASQAFGCDGVWFDWLLLVLLLRARDSDELYTKDVINGYFLFSVIIRWYFQWKMLENEIFHSR